MQIKLAWVDTVTIAHQSVGMVAPQPGTSDHADLGLKRSRGAETSWSVAEEEVVESVASLGLPFLYKSAAAGFAAGRSKKEGSVTVIDGGC